MKGWRNKLKSAIKGPSWIPGLSWTGHDGKRASVIDILNTYRFIFKLWRI